jgi:hypothetical protein
MAMAVAETDMGDQEGVSHDPGHPPAAAAILDKGTFYRDLEDT